MSSTKPAVLLVHNGPKPEVVNREHGNFDVQIRNCLTAGGFSDDEIEIVMVRTFDEDIDRLPDDTSAFRCVILSGSKFDVTMRLPWMTKLSSWLRRQLDIGKPILGICFGHQILADVLGGQVEVNTRGCEVGTYEVRLKDDMVNKAAADPLLSQLPKSFPAVAIHAQTVERIPESAASFYCSDVDNNQIVKFAPDVYGVQFHPEYTIGFVRSLAPFMAYGTSSEADKMRLDQMVPCPMATSIVPRFVRLYLSDNTIKTADQQ